MFYERFTILCLISVFTKVYEQGVSSELIILKRFKEKKCIFNKNTLEISQDLFKLLCDQNSSQGNIKCIDLDYTICKRQLYSHLYIFCLRFQIRISKTYDYYT